LTVVPGAYPRIALRSGASETKATSAADRFQCFPRGLLNFATPEYNPGPRGEARSALAGRRAGSLLSMGLTRQIGMADLDARSAPEGRGAKRRVKSGVRFTRTVGSTKRR